MNVKKFFALAAEKGLEAAELVILKSARKTMEVYGGAVEKYNDSTTIEIMARGIYKGKMGFAMSEKDDNTTAQYLIAKIKDGASVSESEDLSIIFEGSKKYFKKTLYNPALSEVSEADKLAALFKIEKALKTSSPLISDVESVGYYETETEHKFYNSFNLHLSSKNNYFYIVANVVAKKDDDVKSHYKVFLNNDFTKFNADTFTSELTASVLAKLGAKPCATGSYPVVFDPKMTSSLLGAFLSSASAERVEKKTSLFAGKLNEKVASSKISVLDAPLTKNLFYSYFDDEGVARTNKPIIKNGVLLTYLHNLSTATKMGVAPTGHGSNSGGKIGVGISNVALKPGKRSRAEVISGIKEGLLITELMGMHAGLNPTSGDFSLQASGFMIEDGKVTRPVNLITVAGNLVKLFKDVQEVANENELQTSSFTTSSILVKSLKIAG